MIYGARHSCSGHQEPGRGCRCAPRAGVAVAPCPSNVLRPSFDVWPLRNDLESEIITLAEPGLKPAPLATLERTTECRGSGSLPRLRTLVFRGQVGTQFVAPTFRRAINVCWKPTNDLVSAALSCHSRCHSVHRRARTRRTKQCARHEDGHWRKRQLVDES